MKPMLFSKQSEFLNTINEWGTVTSILFQKL